MSIALATQQSKAAKEQLQVARAEQKDLLEDLCDIEDEVDTKLGIFRVHINGKNMSVCRVCGNTLLCGRGMQSQQYEFCYIAFIFAMYRYMVYCLVFSDINSIS